MSEGWQKPAGFEDPESGWSNESAAYDDSFSTYAYSSVLPLNWSRYLNLLPCGGSIYTNKIRFYAEGSTADISAAWIDVYYSNTWNVVDSYVAFTYNTWKEVPFSATTVEKARIRFYNTNGTSTVSARLKEFEFYGLTTTSTSTTTTTSTSTSTTTTSTSTSTTTTTSSSTSTSTTCTVAPAWNSPVNHEDPDGQWHNEVAAYDDNLATYAYHSTLPLHWSP